MATVLNLKSDHPQAIGLLMTMLELVSARGGVRISCIGELPDGTIPLEIDADPQSEAVREARRQIAANKFRIVSEEHDGRVLPGPTTA